MPIKAIMVEGWDRGERQSSVNVWMDLAMLKSDVPFIHEWVSDCVDEKQRLVLYAWGNRLQDWSANKLPIKLKYTIYMCMYKQTGPCTCIISLLSVFSVFLSSLWCSSEYVMRSILLNYSQMCVRECSGGKIWNMICISVCTEPDKCTSMDTVTQSPHTKPDREITENLKWTNSQDLSLKCSY